MRRNFKHYRVSDLITIYSFLNDFSSYSSIYTLIADIEDEIVYRFENYLKEGENDKPY